MKYEMKATSNYLTGFHWLAFHPSHKAQAQIARFKQPSEKTDGYWLHMPRV